MKRKLCTVLTTALIAVMISACGNTVEPIGKNDKPNEEKFVQSSINENSIEVEDTSEKDMNKINGSERTDAAQDFEERHKALGELLP